ncbi:PREDICTED: uncharacterized protein LOC106749247 isoform X2 [Dinoponera quadriceps]|uniref:Uncharacterized protein LOC106749247 isoform X2 n=1 Tax=Dinoponera quadriceps TaxID=609295 RepID=A0A6P3XZL7_DINQU|nr:PREDICTED: uncharacterized protein LOC106749247 isoform X2 [Dinoponera quadriceps]
MIDYFVCYVFPALSHIFCVAVVLTKVEEVLENWQDKLQHNAASRPSETVGPVCRNVPQQQQCIELEREQTKKAEIKLKDMVSWLTEREAHHKMYLGCLEKENEDLRYTLTDMQRKRDQDELANNIKVSKLQNEIADLRMQVAQLSNEYKQQIISRDQQHKDEISKYKCLLEDETARALQLPQTKHNILGKNKKKTTEKHPALIDEEEVQKTKKFPELEIRKITIKRRKLFQLDNETTIDIN